MLKFCTSHKFQNILEVNVVIATHYNVIIQRCIHKSDLKQTHVEDQSNIY